MPAIVTADLHVTDNPKDEHRWGLLPWLGKTAAKHRADVFILGDITDAKDKHSEVLVNRLVAGLRDLAEQADTYIIPGNHDGIDAEFPYFRFLDGLHENLHFVLKPTPIDFADLGGTLFLPHTKDYEAAWSVPLAHHLPSGMVNYIFTHQTYDGCLTENGTRLEGIPPSVFKNFKGQVFSGDIHKPQKVSRNIEYVGAPYRCRFGEDYTPRVLMIGRTPKGGHQQQDLRYPCKDKHLIKLFNCTLAEAVKMGKKWNIEEMYAGDQVKVRVELGRADMPNWPKIRQQVVEDAATLGLELTGPEAIILPDAPADAPTAKGKRAQVQTGPQGQVAAYARQKGASEDLAKAGQALLAQALGGA